MDTVARTQRAPQPAPTAPSTRQAATTRPPSVGAPAWAELCRQALLLQLGGEDTKARLSTALTAVVRAMRDAREPWDAIYLALASSVTTGMTPSFRDVTAPPGHPTMADAIVSLMHCWADCLRLEELEQDP